MSARVIVLAGPSGSGKSRLAARLGLPVLRLDDFYRSAGDPMLPLIDPTASAGAGHDATVVDWDHPDSWLPDDAVGALAELCRTGTVEVPVYDIARSARTGVRRLDLGDAPLVVAEGIFAPDVVAPLADAGLLAAALCVRRPATLTFALRLQRDLRERRKPPVMLVRRGLTLMREQRGVVARAVAKGCEPVGLRAAGRRVAGLSPAPTAVRTPRTGP